MERSINLHKGPFDGRSAKVYYDRSLRQWPTVIEVDTDDNRVAVYTKRTNREWDFVNYKAPNPFSAYVHVHRYADGRVQLFDPTQVNDYSDIVVPTGHPDPMKFVEEQFVGGRTHITITDDMQ